MNRCKRTTIALFLAVLALGWQSCGTEDDTTSESILEQELDTAVQANQGYGGGLLRIWKLGQGLVWEGVSGNAVAQTAVPMSLSDTFEIASITKTFTATVILLLMEDGVLGLDEAIGISLPSSLTTGLLVIDGHDYGPEITVRQLLNHSSGLADYWNDPPYITPGVNAFLTEYLRDVDRFWKPEEIIDYCKQLKPIGVPGETYHYSDSNYVLLGLLIQQVTGEQLHDVFRQRIFTLHGLQNTYLAYRERAVWTGTESHRYDGEWDMHGTVHQSADWAGGGLVSSARDLTAFLGALAKDEVFKNPSTQTQMQQWIPTGEDGISYGLGLFRVVLSPQLGDVWGHEGYGSSWMYYWPQQQILFIGTLNQAENDSWDLLLAAARVMVR